MKELETIESSRLYYWNEDVAVKIKGITHYKKVKGEHHLRTLDGRYHVIAEGWAHLEIDATEPNG